MSLARLVIHHQYHLSDKKRGHQTKNNLSLALLASICQSCMENQYTKKNV